MRQVDDVPVVSPKDTSWCKTFSEVYTEICREANIELAKNCPQLDKAFFLQNRGKVLGILFDATDMTWCIPNEKRRKTLSSIHEIYYSEVIILKRMQKLMGRLNHICQMCSFLKIFMSPLNESFAGIRSDADPNTVLTLSAQARKDLLIWAGFLLSDFQWLPVPAPKDPPCSYRKEIVTDAASLPESQRWRPGIGCGGVGLSETGMISFAFHFDWPTAFLSKIDEKGASFGSKTTCLEALGLLLPIISFPDYFRNSQVVVKIDCMGVVFGIINKSVSGDKCASIFVRAFLLIAAYLECEIHVQHLPRKSDWDSDVADRLSRRQTMTINDQKMVDAFPRIVIPSCLNSWFRNPTPDWEIAKKILEFVMK